jgi:hypothetical protein
MSEHDENEDAMIGDVEEHDDEVDMDDVEDPIIPAIDESEES